MKAKKIIYIIGAVVCSTLAIIFRTVALPIALAYDALDAMANTSNEATDQLLENTKTMNNEVVPPCKNIQRGSL